jgi:enediyne biosynthesis protein E3
MRLLALPSNAADFSVRGFHGAAAGTRAVLERHGQAFIAGFNTALAVPPTPMLIQALGELELEERGFAYEGAAMALGVLDTMRLVDPARLPAFISGAGHSYRYLVHVGCGWAMARLRLRRPRLWRQLDPLLRWLAFDGWGFHEGLFKPSVVVGQQRRSRLLRGYELRAFDQGLGRSLWFITGADVGGLTHAVRGFERERYADLWSGVGLAAVYAGGAHPSELEALVAAAGPYAAHLAQGAAFAAKARLHGSNLGPMHKRAVQVLCKGLSAFDAATVTDQALGELRRDGSAEDYERWRTAIRQALHLPRDRISREDRNSTAEEDCDGGMATPTRRDGYGDASGRRLRIMDADPLSST